MTVTGATSARWPRPPPRPPWRTPWPHGAAGGARQLASPPELLSACSPLGSRAPGLCSRCRRAAASPRTLPSQPWGPDAHGHETVATCLRALGAVGETPTQRHLSTCPHETTQSPSPSGRGSSWRRGCLARGEEGSGPACVSPAAAASTPPHAELAARPAPQTDSKRPGPGRAPKRRSERPLQRAACPGSGDPRGQTPHGSVVGSVGALLAAGRPSERHLSAPPPPPAPQASSAEAQRPTVRDTRLWGCFLPIPTLPGVSLSVNTIRFESSITKANKEGLS